MKSCSNCRFLHLKNNHLVCDLKGALDSISNSCNHHTEKLKCYEVCDKYYENTTIVWATTANKAKVKALSIDILNDCPYIDLRIKRRPQWDNYTNIGIPIEELLEDNWWFNCGVCGKGDLSQADLDIGNAIIISTDGINRDFVNGDIICKKCAKKLGLRIKLKILFKKIFNIFKRRNNDR